MTPEQEIARKKKLVSAAKSLLSLQSGFGIGCTRINKILFWLGSDYRDRFPVFGQFLKASINYPIGNERLLWAYEPLLELDKKLAVVESQFRALIIESCIAIIKEYG